MAVDLKVRHHAFQAAHRFFDERSFVQVGTEPLSQSSNDVYQLVLGVVGPLPHYYNQRL